MQRNTSKKDKIISRKPGVMALYTDRKFISSQEFNTFDQIIDKQANYIGVKKEGPFKDDTYRY